MARKSSRRRAASARKHRSPRTAFVLAGGGSLGAVQVGMLKALARQRVMPDFVVGASVGAINGAYFAGEPDLRGATKLEWIWQRLDRSVVFPFSPISSLLGFLGLRDHLVDTDRLRRLLRSGLPYRRLEDAAIPCHVVATNVLDGKEFVMTKGPAVRALLASAAIPAIYPVVTTRHRHLVDGGIASNTPIAAALRARAERLIILPTGLSCELKHPPRGAAAVALHALNVLMMRQLVDDLNRFAGRAELITLPPLCPVNVNAYDFSQSANLIRRSESQSRRWLSRHGLHAQGTPSELAPHDH